MKFLNFISIAFISNVYSKILTLEEEDQSLFNLTGKIIEAFFVDQESVTIFNVDKSLELREQESSVAKVIQGIAPVMIYDELCDELAVKISDMGEELDLPSTTKSYLLTTASIDLMTKYLPLFAKINTNGKWIFAMIDIKQSEIESILVKAWVEHHMANIVVLMFFEDEMRVMSFNPFELHNNKHGTFWSPSEVTSENLSDILEKLEDIFDGKVRNLQNYQLFATRFLEISEHNKILDKEMMKVFETTLNTKFVLTSSLDGEYHGNRLDNGSFTGSIRMVEKGLTDIAMNNRLMSPMESTNCAFLNPAGETSMKYVMKKSPQASTFLQFHLIQAFDKKTGIFYALTSIIFILVLLFSSVFKRKFMKRFIIDDVSMTLLMTVGIQCSVSMPLKKKTSAQRILIISLVVFSLITCNAYQGTIVSNLSRPVASKGTIDTLEQLLQSNLNLTVLTSLPDIFSSNDDESNVNRIQKLLHQRQIINHSMKVEEVDKILLNKENQAVLSKLMNRIS